MLRPLKKYICCADMPSFKSAKKLIALHLNCKHCLRTKTSDLSRRALQEEVYYYMLSGPLFFPVNSSLIESDLRKALSEPLPSPLEGRFRFKNPVSILPLRDVDLITVRPVLVLPQFGPEFSAINRSELQS